MPGISILVPGARARCPADEAAHGRISPDEAGTTRSGPGPPGGAPRRGTDDGTGEVSMTQEPHREDGADGARRRLAAAAPSLRQDIGVATECGIGRAPAGTTEGILRTHAEVAEPL